MRGEKSIEYAGMRVKFAVWNVCVSFLKTDSYINRVIYSVIGVDMRNFNVEWLQHAFAKHNVPNSLKPRQKTNIRVDVQLSDQS